MAMNGSTIDRRASFSLERMRKIQHITNMRPTRVVPNLPKNRAVASGSADKSNKGLSRNRSDTTPLSHSPERGTQRRTQLA